MNNAALITGGSKRLGKAMSLALAEMGYDIALHYYLSRDEAEKAAHEVRDIGVKCELFYADLALDSNLVSQAHEKFPNLNVLINSASIFEEGAIAETSLEQFHRNFAINFKAPFLLSKEFAVKCKNGVIINLLDANIVKNKSTHAAYLLSKKALGEFTKMAAVEYAPRIRVNGIAPGIILPPPGKGESHFDGLLGKVPLGRKGDVSDIVDVAKLLIMNKYLTGQIIFVDGGMNLT